MITEINLQGTWGFRLDEAGEGISKGFCSLPYEDTIELPSTVSLSRKGIPAAEKKPGCLTDEYVFEGDCWYYRNIETGFIPEDAKAELFLERTRLTKLWVNISASGTVSVLLTSTISPTTSKTVPQKYA